MNKYCAECDGTGCMYKDNRGGCTTCKCPVCRGTGAAVTWLAALELGLRWLEDRSVDSRYESFIDDVVDHAMQSRLEEINSLELGLRWLDERAQQQKIMYVYWYKLPWHDCQAAANLELGLRWLHDRAYESLYANSPRWNVLTLRAVCYIELGLRWLHDRAFWTGMHRTGDTCYTCGKYIDIEQEIDALELGLRWLHDLSSRCTDCGAINERMIRLWPLDINKPSRRRCSECVRARGSIINWGL